MFPSKSNVFKWTVILSNLQLMCPTYVFSPIFFQVMFLSELLPYQLNVSNLVMPFKILVDESFVGDNSASSSVSRHQYIRVFKNWISRWLWIQTWIPKFSKKIRVEWDIRQPTFNEYCKTHCGSPPVWPVLEFLQFHFSIPFVVRLTKIREFLFAKSIVLS